MSNDIVTTDISMGMLQASSPKALVAGATEMANELAKVIESRRLYNDIGGKRFVRVEGWTTLGAMLGCMPQEVSNDRHDDGRYVAVVELVRMTDRQVVSRASGECGAPGEARWGDADEYAKRSMAATRATSKAGRLAFSWIMVLAGFEATPAEEIDGKARQNIEGQSRQHNNSQSDDGAMITFGKHKGKKYTEVESGYLKWLVENAQKDAVKALAKAELDRRGNAGNKPTKENTDGMNQSQDMATETDIRLIRESAKAQEISIKEVLETFDLESTDKIRRIDVPYLLAWISNPANMPSQLPAY